MLNSIRRISDRVIADERDFVEELRKRRQAIEDDNPKKQREELIVAKRRLEELDRLISSLYENFVSELLPEKQYKTLMKKYSTEQTELESRVSEIEQGLEETTMPTIQIERFIKLIKKYKEPSELTCKMAKELIDKIVVHEAEGRKPNRRQQVNIYYNFIGQFDLPFTEEEIAQAKEKAEREAEEKKRRKQKRQKEHLAAFRVKEKAERLAANDGHKFAKYACEYCAGKIFDPRATGSVSALRNVTKPMSLKNT